MNRVISFCCHIVTSITFLEVEAIVVGGIKMNWFANLTEILYVQVAWNIWPAQVCRVEGDISITNQQRDVVGFVREGDPCDFMSIRTGDNTRTLFLKVWSYWSSLISARLAISDSMMLLSSLPRLLFLDNQTFHLHLSWRQGEALLWCEALLPRLRRTSFTSSSLFTRFPSFSLAFVCLSASTPDSMSSLILWRCSGFRRLCLVLLFCVSDLSSPSFLEASLWCAALLPLWLQGRTSFASFCSSSFFLPWPFFLLFCGFVAFFCISHFASVPTGNTSRWLEALLTLCFRCLSSLVSSVVATPFLRWHFFPFFCDFTTYSCICCFIFRSIAICSWDFSLQLSGSPTLSLDLERISLCFGGLLTCHVDGGFQSHQLDGC